MLAFVLVAGALLFWRNDVHWAVERGRELYAQHRCLTLEPPEGTVVYEEDPARARQLLQSADYRPATTPDGKAVAALRWPKEAREWPGMAKHLWLTPPPAVLFMHEVRSPRGERVLLVATANYEQGMPDGVGFRVEAITPATWHQASQGAAGLATIMVKPPRDRDSRAARESVGPVRIFAGRIDPKDPSRVLIEYEGGGDHGFAEIQVFDNPGRGGFELNLGWRRIMRDASAK